MKKLVYTFVAISFASSIMLAQDTQKGVRFGVFGRIDPAWYNMTTNANYSKGGAVLGTGFGLNLEFRISDVVSFQTGIGGDFDGGKIKYACSVNSNPVNDVYTGYILDKTPAMVDIKGHSLSDYTNTAQYTGHDLTSRHIHTTYITIPLLLKMKTKEIGGFKYFVDFGGHIGVLAAATADDNTSAISSTNTIITDPNAPPKGLSIYKDCIPVRVGLNVGLGAEYRLAGTTSVYMSANFVNSFISVVKAKSVYNATSVDPQGNFTYAAQSLKAAGIQINVGFLF